MDKKKSLEFKLLFEKFKLSEEYEQRKQQLCFVNVAKEIITETIKNRPLTNEHLTGLIQMFKVDCSNENFEKYLKINISNEAKRNEISEQAYECGENGYTGAGLRKIEGLSNEQLDEIKILLSNAFNITRVEDAIELCIEYERKSIPLVTKGIYSPWLYYIQPAMFPVINDSHKPFLKWIDVPHKYGDCIRLYAKLKELTNEGELGILDAFTYEFEKYLVDYTQRNNIKEFNLNGRSLYKMSHGAFVKRADFRKAGTAKKMEDEKWICLHEETGKGQGEAFRNAEIGDYIFLCYGGDKLGCIGKIISDSDYIPEDKLNYVDKDEGWIYRTIEPLFSPVDEDISDFKSERSFWMPSGNSTFYPIPSDDLDYANEKIFIPKYEVKIIDKHSEVSSNSNDNKMSELNTIIYGPPGTGKTYKTIIKAAKIITDKDLQYNEAKAIFEPLLGDQIEFITFHQNYSYEDFVIGLKPKLEGTQLAFEKHEGVFYKICDRARKNYYAWKEGLEATEPKFENVFTEYLKPLQTAGGEIEEKLGIANKSFFISGIGGNMLQFRSENNPSESLDIDKIKALYTDGTSPTDTKHIFYTPIVKALQNIAERLKKEVVKVKLKNYVLIIDEINRANISRVFGELITLLEEDKRLGNNHQMIVSLSNGERFSVPKNLYVLGTMNTADKSIALIDIALRRRFVFEDMYPRPRVVDELVKHPYSEFLKTLNEQILAKKGADFLIGHSYLMEGEGKEFDFVSAMNHKIIPLLNEYFYNQRDSFVLSVLQTAIAKVPGYTVSKDDYIGVLCTKQ